MFGLPKHFVNEIKQGNVIFGYTEAVRLATNEFNNYNPALSAAADNQRKLADETEKTTNASKRQADQFQRIRQFYIDLADRSLDRFSAIESFDTPLELLDRKRLELEEMLNTLESDKASGLIDEDMYTVQKSGLDTSLERLAKQRDAAAKKEVGDTFLGQVRAAMKTPLEKFREELTRIEEELGDPLNEELGFEGIYADEKKFAQLQAKKRFLESLPPEQQVGDRPAALLKGSAAAFSASFGAKPVDKIQAEIKRIQERILDVMKNIDKKTGAEFKIPGA